MQPEEKVEIKEAVRKALDTDMVAQEIPRIVHGRADDPYILEVTVTRQTDLLPPGLLEIHITKSPKVPEPRAMDVMQHALVDVFGPNPPLYLVPTPNGEMVPAYDWFDPTGQFQKLKGVSQEVKEHLKKSGGMDWGRNSLWLVLNREESNMRAPVMSWVAGKLWSALLGRHRELRDG